MSFAKNVNKYYKWVLGSIVAVLAIALVVPATVGQNDRDTDKPHATIFGSVTVTEREWFEALAKSGAWYRMKVVRKIDEATDYESQQMAQYLFKAHEDGAKRAQSKDSAHQLIEEAQLFVDAAHQAYSRIGAPAS